MRYLILCALCLLPLSAFAQPVTPLPSGPTDSVTILHPSPGVSYLYDQSGHSATVYQTAPGVHWYSAEDRYGKITAQGYVFEPMPPPKPLAVPWSSTPDRQDLPP